MAGSTRIKGTKLALTLGTPGTDYWHDMTSYELFNDEAESDVTTFADAAEGGARQHKLKGTAIQSTAADSFWRYVWANTGQDVPFTLAPHGNATPTASQPHFIGTVTIGPKPSLGGEAGTGAFTFEFEWLVTGEPVMDDGA
jgi:hypothetical protein